VHAIFYIECPPIVFNLRYGKVEGQHHFVLRYGKIQGLLDSLRVNAKAAKHAYHLIGIARVPTEAVPFGE
jgi:hypothetical protein